MAQKRMIDKKISVSEQVNNMSVHAQCIYTWSIPHADDLGLLPYSLKTLKATIVPMWDINLESFGNHWQEIIHQGLIKEFEWEGEKFWWVTGFLNHQTLKRDRKPVTLAKGIHDWGLVERIGIQMETNGIPSKEKRSEDINNKGGGKVENLERLNAIKATTPIKTIS